MNNKEQFLKLQYKGWESRRDQVGDEQDIQNFSLNIKYKIRNRVKRGIISQDDIRHDMRVYATH